MKIKKKMKALAAWLHKLFPGLFTLRKEQPQAEEPVEIGSVEEFPETATTVETPQEVTATEDESPGYAAEIRRRLEYLRRKRILHVRKQPHRMEWTASPADFTDAYLFFLNLPRVDAAGLECRQAAGNITYTVQPGANLRLELTDKVKHKNGRALIRLTQGNDCILQIYFIEPLKQEDYEPENNDR